MKQHIMIALGLLLAAVFSFRVTGALVEPGFGFLELYLVGGLVIAGLLLFSGLKERRYARSRQADTES